MFNIGYRHIGGSVNISDGVWFKSLGTGRQIAM